MDVDGLILLGFLATVDGGTPYRVYLSGLSGSSGIGIVGTPYGMMDLPFARAGAILGIDGDISWTNTPYS